MINSDSHRNSASIKWMAEQLNQLKTDNSPALAEVLAQLVKINRDDIIARNAHNHGKLDAQTYMDGLAQRRAAIQFKDGNEYPYKRDNGTPASVYATSLLRKFETMQIDERIGAVADEMDKKIRYMTQTGLAQTEHVVKHEDAAARRAREWADTDPDSIEADEILTDADFNNYDPFTSLPAAAPIVPPIVAKVDKWSLDSVHAAELVIRHNLATYKGKQLEAYVAETLQPLHKEVLTELQTRAATDNKADSAHLLTFMGSVSAHIKQARVTLAPTVQTTQAIPAAAMPHLQAASVSAQASLKEIAPAKSFRERLGDVVEAGSKFFSGVKSWFGNAAKSVVSQPVRNAAAALLLGSVVSTGHNADTGDRVAPGAKPTLTVKADPDAHRASGGAVTQAPVILASFTETAAPPVAVKAAFVEAPKEQPAPATPKVRTSYKAAAADPAPYAMPDEVSVTIGGGIKSRFDVFTVKAACDQVPDSQTCKEVFAAPAPKNS